MEKHTRLIRYLVSFLIASAIAVAVFAVKGFFGDSTAVNIQILSDGFSVAGMLFLIVAGMNFISGEGAVIGISFVLRNVVLAFIPMGRKKHETYGKYRERKMQERKRSGDHCVLVVGLLFFALGVAFTVIWYCNYYTLPG